MILQKKFYWNSIYNFDTYVFDVYVYNEEDEMVYKSHVEHPCELKMHVEAIKNHLLANNSVIIRQEVNKLTQRRKQHPSINGKTLKEAISIQDYTSDKALQKAMTERKAIHALKM